MADARGIKQKMIAYHAQRNSFYRKSIDDYRDSIINDFKEIHPDDFKKFYDEAKGADAPENEQTVLGILRDHMNFHAAAMDFLLDAA